MLIQTERSKRLRIGVEFHAWDGRFEGLRSHVVGLFAAAIALPSEFDFVFFLQDPQGLARAHPEFHAAHVQLVQAPGWHGLLRTMFELPYLRHRHSIDLLHTQYRIPLFPMGPVACTIHDTLFETHPQHFGAYFTAQAKLTFRHAARHSELLFTVSEFSRRELSRCYEVPAHRILLTPNGVAAQRFHPGSAGQAQLAPLGLSSRGYLLTVGRLEPRKNHATLLRAYAQLGMDAPPLVIVGQAQQRGYKESLERCARSLGVANKVRFLDAVDDNVLPILMRHALCFIYPSFAEGFGMPVLEAMASGVPVIASATSALPEVTGGAALLIDPGSCSELLQAIQHLLGSEAERANLGQSGLIQAARFSWKSSAQGLLAGYREFFHLPRDPR